MQMTYFSPEFPGRTLLGSSLNKPAYLRPGTVAVARGAEVFQVFIRKLARVRSERG